MGKSSNRGMSMGKHRLSGHSQKSPKMRLWEKMEAEKGSKKKKKTSMFSSVKEAFKKGGISVNT